MDVFLEKLSAHRIFGIKPRLDTIRLLLERLGHPERDIAVIHIAGTNGKGSVAAIIEATLRTIGYPVGRYTSPHLVRVNERFLINGTAVDDAALSAALAEVEGACATIGTVTFFEVLTATAWVLFRNAGVKLAVMEVGLGGRYDATNVMDLPLISVITRIGLDHCAILGDTLTAIAHEKGGIIKPNCPVVFGAMPDEALTELKRIAAEQHAPTFSAPDSLTVTPHKASPRWQTFKIVSQNHSYPPALSSLTGSYQLENVATAVCALELLMDRGIDIPEKAVIEGLRTVEWPGRFQLLDDDPVTFLDGGHNPDALRALRNALKALHIRKNVALVAGFCGDKAVSAALRELAPICSIAWAVKTSSERSLPPTELALKMRAVGIPTAHAYDDLCSAIDAATQWASDHNGAVLICGSLFLVGDVLRLRGEIVASRVDANESL